MTSFNCHGVWNHRQLYCSVNRLFRLTAKKTSKLRITSLLWVKVTGDRWTPIEIVSISRLHNGNAQVLYNFAWFQFNDIFICCPKNPYPLPCCFFSENNLMVLLPIFAMSSIRQTRSLLIEWPMRYFYGSAFAILWYLRQSWSPTH